MQLQDQIISAVKTTLKISTVELK